MATTRATLSRELSHYLVDYARERGLRPIAEPAVELLEDHRLRTGSVRAEARFVDLAPAHKTEVDAAVEGTRRLRLADLASAPARIGAATRRGVLWLTDRLGLRFALDPQAGWCASAAPSTTTWSIDNQRVSRYHAQLRWVESSWLVYDLDSTNGTFVDEQRVPASQPAALRPGACCDWRLRAARRCGPAPGLSAH